MDRYPADELEPDIEVWEPDGFEPTSPASAMERTRGINVRGRIARSLPGAVVGTFLIAAMAFGAALQTTSTSPAAGADGDTDHAALVDGTTEGADKTKADGEPDAAPADGEAAGADRATGDGATEADKPAAEADKPAEDSTEPTDAPAPEPTIETIELAVHLGDGRVKVAWSACDPDGFRYYKVVRSSDEHPTWPLGDGDKLVAAIEDSGTTTASNGDLPLGKKLFYRVFAVVQRGDKLVVACQSPVRGIAIPAPTPKPEPTPEPTENPVVTLALSLSIKEGQPFLDWSACERDFHYYKIVRSTNSSVTWPKGEGDSLAGVVGHDGKTALFDGDAPSGKKVWYRVFCVRETDAGWKVIGASPAKAIEVPAHEPDPEPEPVAIGFEVGRSDGGGVSLHWEGCGGESFIAYKVVRSAGPNPSYLPGTDGSQVIGVIENREATSLADNEVAAGQTWYYRVQCIGWMNDHKILLGQTAAIAITVE